MSRFWYDGDDDDYPAHWFLNDLERRIASKPGQRALREFIDAMLALPQRRLAYSALLTEEGEVCAVGCYAAAKGVDLSDYVGEHEDSDVTISVGRQAGLAKALAIELAWLNDSDEGDYTPEQRWKKLYKWACAQVKWHPPALMSV